MPLDTRRVLATDPIFAAIDRYEKARIAQEKAEDPGEEVIAEQVALAASDDLWDTRPTTREGLRALIVFTIDDCERNGEPSWGLMTLKLVLELWDQLPI